MNAPTNQTLPGYDWPRHSGATFFLAQAASLTHDPELAAACARAAALLRGAALSKCGDLPCVGDEAVVDLGSSCARSPPSPRLSTEIATRATRPRSPSWHFIRTQQRPDGEFMHEYDRIARHPLDDQGLYYSSEATLALARAYGITHDPADLDAAVRGLRYVVGPAWSFFGDRYYFGEEHWTCQAMAVLWPYAPDQKAFDFCLRWQAYGRKLQQEEGDSYFDAEGAVGLGPVVTPRLTPVGSRGEAAVATLEVARKIGLPAKRNYGARCSVAAGAGVALATTISSRSPTSFQEPRRCVRGDARQRGRLGASDRLRAARRQRDGALARDERRRSGCEPLAGVV